MWCDVYVERNMERNCRVRLSACHCMDDNTTLQQNCFIVAHFVCHSSIIVSLMLWNTARC